MFNRKNSNTDKFLDCLGYRCRDRVTGISGVITHVGFDLYGCIQVIVNPGKRSDTSVSDTIWMDINRLEIDTSERVMEPPRFQDVDPDSLGVKMVGKKPAGNGPCDIPSRDHNIPT